jgi:predicted glycosyltransferase
LKDLTKKNILVAPLDWGLGHTTRCIPIIYALQKYNCTIIVAISGTAKKLIENEFPTITIIDIPNYNVQYGTSSFTTGLKLLSQISKINKAIKNENSWLKEIVKTYSIDIVLSDNRYGLHHKNVQTVFITHQLKPKGLLGKLGENFLQKKLFAHINKFDACWVMDYENEHNLAGELSHPTLMPFIPTNYIGAVTRFTNKPTEIVYTCAIVLSGPEPQRTILENNIIAQLKNTKENIIIVRGLPNEKNIIKIENSNCTIVNYAGVVELNKIILQSAYIICRSGYTSIMDLLLLQKKCIFIPTPAQSEQVYLTKYLSSKSYCLYFSQREFNIHLALQKAKQFDFKDFKQPQKNGLQEAIEKLISQ